MNRSSTTNGKRTAPDRDDAEIFECELAGFENQEVEFVKSPEDRKSKGCQLAPQTRLNVNIFRLFSFWVKKWAFWRKCNESRVVSRLLDGFFWLTIGSVLSRIAVLIATIFVARILGKEVYGEFSLIRSTVSAFVVLASFGMGRTATKYIAELLIVDKIRVGRIVALNYLFSLFSSSIIASFFYFLAPYLCEETINAPHLIPQVRLSAILLILSAFVGSQSGVLSGFQAFRQLSITTAISGFASIPFYLLGAYFGGLSGAVIGFAFASFFNCLINGFFIYFQLKKYGVRYRFAESWQEISVLWNFCLPSTLAALSTSAVAWGYSILLTRQSDGFAQMALFDAARQIQTCALYIPNMAAQVILPALTELNARKNKELYIKTIKYNVAINALCSLFFALIATLFATSIMRSFGAGFEDGKTALILLVITGVVISVCNVCGSVLTSWGRVWTSFWLNSLWGITLLTAAWISAIFETGANGIAFALLFSYVVHLICCIFFMNHFFRKIF